MAGRYRKPPQKLWNVMSNEFIVDWERFMDQLPRCANWFHGNGISLTTPDISLLDVPLNKPARRVTSAMHLSVHLRCSLLCRTSSVGGRHGESYPWRRLARNLKAVRCVPRPSLPLNHSLVSLRVQSIYSTGSVRRKRGGRVVSRESSLNKVHTDSIELIKKLVHIMMGMRRRTSIPGEYATDKRWLSLDLGFLQG
uniref:Uncharacterized protein n=1 Tax=Timema monikensis TaxID=170555 RepID=A0A7R9DXB2_9NEOP|nr:unnamed protein product [Timema monikensis]